MDGSDLNSPARGTRTDATGMGGESGESSGGFDDDDTDNQDYKDAGVEDAPTETIGSSEAPTSDAPTGEQAPRLPPTVASRGQRGSTLVLPRLLLPKNRRRTSTHNTPISRPRNRQR